MLRYFEENGTLFARPPNQEHMYEVEVKVRADHDAVRERLGELGAIYVETVIQEDTYFDAPHRNFGETDEALRIRDVSVVDEPSDERIQKVPPVPRAGVIESRVTYKGPLVGTTAKTRKEFESEIQDPDTMRSILDRLGFEPVATVRKVRDRYELGEYVVTLDHVKNLGTFVEVETHAVENDLESARQGAFEVVENLGLDPTKSLQTSYLELLLADSK